ncbi:MAG: zinc ABC transporter substrate-binding protein [Maritimibacter sp.]|nr:zinc ABC transporter substrate-binding protein [Maritimibacter sp.]
MLRLPLRPSLAALALTAAPALADPPAVVVDIAPVHALVTQVMAGIATPALLLDQEADPHAVQLRPSQARMLADADLMIWVGPALEPWLARLADGATADQIVLMEAPATLLRDFDDHDADHAEDDDHEDDHEGDDHEEHDEDGHDHQGADPHVWLSPDNARAWLGHFAATLAEADPENAEAYRANAAAAQARIDALTARIEARLAPVHGAEIVTFHDAFGYFADRFDISIAGTVRPGDAATPSAAAMAELEEIVATHEIACAFAEPAFDPGLIDAIAGDTGLRIGTLDPTGALLNPGPDHYEATLMAVADSIADCLEAK